MAVKELRVRHAVVLTEQERDQVKAALDSRFGVTRARAAVLLAADRLGQHTPFTRIAREAQVMNATATRTCRGFEKVGLSYLYGQRPGPVPFNRQQVLGVVEDILKSPAPKGRNRWSLVAISKEHKARGHGPISNVTLRIILVEAGYVEGWYKPENYND